MLGTAAEVHEQAEAISRRLTAITRLRIGGGEPVQYSDAVIEPTPNGPRKHAFMRGHITASGRLRVRAVIVEEGGVVRPPTPPESWEKDLALAATDRLVDRTMAFFAAPSSWVTLWAALDLVEGDTRVPTAARSRRRNRSHSFRKIASQGWASDDELLRFDGTALSFEAVGTAARHGRPIPRPDDPMSLAEGRELVARVIRPWMMSPTIRQP